MEIFLPSSYILPSLPFSYSVPRLRVSGFLFPPTGLAETMFWRIGRKSMFQTGRYQQVSALVHCTSHIDLGLSGYDLPIPE